MITTFWNFAQPNTAKVIDSFYYDESPTLSNKYHLRTITNLTIDAILRDSLCLDTRPAVKVLKHREWQRRRRRTHQAPLPHPLGFLFAGL